ncbi:MAG: YeeE/YedE thiosulfate transporter family protein, partial [bacterium]|nr:YeeE/YedE thiosulfate transporter family protein [bacterium]
MFTGENLWLAWVILSAIVTGAIGMQLIKLFGGKGFRHAVIDIKQEPFTKATVVGGAIFGLGWAVSGACPGTVLAQIGEGKVLGLFTVIGLLAGTYLYALLLDKYPNIAPSAK